MAVAMAWNELAYDDGGWTAGAGGVGYERGAGYESYFDIDVESAMWDKQTTCLIRIPFAIAAGALADKSGAEIRVRYDDAYVAYLNGTEIARKNFTGSPDGNSTGSSHADGSAVVLEAVDISAYFGLLNEGGDNLLAIHGLNTSAGSSDFLISAELRISESPSGGGVGGNVSPTAIAYTGTVPIDATTRVPRARPRCLRLVSPQRVDLLPRRECPGGLRDHVQPVAGDRCGDRCRPRRQRGLRVLGADEYR